MTRNDSRMLQTSSTAHMVFSHTLMRCLRHPHHSEPQPKDSAPPRVHSCVPSQPCSEPPPRSLGGRSSTRACCSTGTTAGPGAGSGGLGSQPLAHGSRSSRGRTCNSAMEPTTHTHTSLRAMCDHAGTHEWTESVQHAYRDHDHPQQSPHNLRKYPPPPPTVTFTYFMAYDTHSFADVRFMAHK